MSILIIGQNEYAEIAKAIEQAKQRPLTIEDMKRTGTNDSSPLMLKDRKEEFFRPPSAHVVFPGGYRAAFSLEEQPPGLCSHLSISVEGRAKKGMMPNVAAVQMIAEAFGVPFPPMRGWTEEFEPGEFAINLVSLWTPKREGSA